MPSRTGKTPEQGFDRAMGEAKRQASNVAMRLAPQRAKRPVHSKLRHEKLSRTSPTAVGIALAVGWLLGRIHTPNSEGAGRVSFLFEEKPEGTIGIVSAKQGA
jgi:hypothetical protein